MPVSGFPIPRWVPAAVLAALAGCGGSSPSEARLEYRLVDFAFVGPTRAEGPSLVFEAENTGTQEHELEILDPAGEAVGEIEAFPPAGEAPPLAVELEPGTYTLQCILETPDGRIHKDLGMVAELVVE